VKVGKVVNIACDNF